jgi:nucleoside-diphosphate-sugar epimerase
VDAFLAVGVTDRAYGTALNVGGIEPVSLIDVARLCQEVAGAGGAVETMPWPPERKKIDIGSIYVDHTRLTELSGWAPQVGLREGLAETFAFYRAHGEHYWS